MIIGGGGDDEESVRTPLKYKESEEIQCPNVKLSNVNPMSLHTTVVGNKLIGKIQQLGTDSGISVRNCTVTGIHVGLESRKVVGSSGGRHRSVVVNFVNGSTDRGPLRVPGEIHSASYPSNQTPS